MEKLKKVVGKLLRYQFVYDVYRFFKKFRLRNFKKMKLIYKTEDLNREYYEKIKGAGYQELEHQIGRLTNFKEIIKECAALDGHFVEFGCWKGFSILWTAYFMERNAVYDKKLIGIDGFVGLPYGDGLFRKGRFSDTSLAKCKKNIFESDEVYPFTKKNIGIVRFLYAEKEAILNYLKKRDIRKFSFIHIDCDVSRSAVEIFSILIDGDLIADKAYILFDDYGIEQNLRDEIAKFINRLIPKWEIVPHSETRFTKNFYFKKKQ